MTALAEVQFSGLALGDSTLADADSSVTATSASTIDSASVDTSVTAAAESNDSTALAMTEIDSYTYADDGDGTGSAVETSTSGLASGETAYTTSLTTTFAIATDGADVAFGMSYSVATGDLVQEADASTLLYGDVTAGTDADVDTAMFSRALSVGIAVDTP